MADSGGGAKRVGRLPRAGGPTSIVHQRQRRSSACNAPHGSCGSVQRHVNTRAMDPAMELRPKSLHANHRAGHPALTLRRISPCALSAGKHVRRSSMTAPSKPHYHVSQAKLSNFSPCFPGHLERLCRLFCRFFAHRAEVTFEDPPLSSRLHPAWSRHDSPCHS